MVTIRKALCLVVLLPLMALVAVVLWAACIVASILED